MRMPSKKDHSARVALLAAALALAACDRANKPAIDMAPAPVMQVASVGNIDDSDAQLSTGVEQRHFAIYNTYRMLFDDSAATVDAKEERALQAAAAMDGDGSVCSMHTVLLQD